MASLKPLMQCPKCGGASLKALKAKHPALNALFRILKKREPKLIAKISAKLTIAGKDVAKQAEALYAEHTATKNSKNLLHMLRKGDTNAENEDIIQKILDGLDLAGMTAVVGAIDDDTLAVFKEAAIQGLKMVGVATGSEAFDMVDKIAQNYVDQRAAELVGKRIVNGVAVDNPDAVFAIDDTTRELLHGVIADAIDAGLTPSELGDVIEGSFGFSEARASTIARTELSFAHNMGNLGGWEASGVVDGKESILGSEHGDIDDECDENADAGVIPLDEDFPSGDIGPPYHPNCVCAMVPSVMDDTTSSQDDSES